MIYYHPDPMGLLTAGEMAGEQRLEYYRLPSGAVVGAVRQAGAGLTIQSILSTDPRDYLRPQLQPGREIRLRPEL